MRQESDSHLDGCLCVGYCLWLASQLGVLYCTCSSLYPCASELAHPTVGSACACAQLYGVPEVHGVPEVRPAFSLVTLSTSPGSEFTREAGTCERAHSLGLAAYEIAALETFFWGALF